MSERNFEKNDSTPSQESTPESKPGAPKQETRGESLDVEKYEQGVKDYQETHHERERESQQKDLEYLEEVKTKHNLDPGTVERIEEFITTEKYVASFAEDKESESGAKKEEIFKNWQELVVGEKKESDIDMDKLDDEQFKDLLYKRTEERLDETTKILGLNIDENLIKRIDEARGKEKKAEAQEEMIKSVVKQINSIPFGTWSFTPKEIERQKKLNCSGAALVCGSMLNKIGIKTEYGNPVGHAMNFAELADGSLLYVDSRNNIVKKIKAEEEKFKELKIRRINDKDIEYKTVPSLSQRDAIVGIFHNIAVLKPKTNLENIEAPKTEARKEAEDIYGKDKALFDSVDYSKLDEELYPDLNKFLHTEEWKEEEERIDELRNFHRNMQKINEKFGELDQEEQKKLRMETIKKKELFRQFLLSDARVKSKLSKSLFGFFSDIKKGLVPLKNWNKEEYEKFIENLLDRIEVGEKTDSDFEKADPETLEKTREYIMTEKYGKDMTERESFREEIEKRENIEEEKIIERAEKNIETFRKKVLEIDGLKPNSEYQLEQEDHDFLFGTEFNDLTLLSKKETEDAKKEILEKYPKYANRIEKHYKELDEDYKESYLKTFEEYFNGATVNTSWRAMDKEGQIDYTKTDKIFSFMNEKPKILERLRGHEVFWNEKEHLPPHLRNAPKEKIKQELFEKRLELLKRYPEVKEWTLLNEPLQKKPKFEDGVDKHAIVFDPEKDIDVFVDLFKKAKEINPETKLYVNEYNILNGEEKTDKYIKFIQDLLDNGAPIDGIGVQGHIFSTRKFATPKTAGESLDKLSELGLPIKITEFDVSNEVIAENYKIENKEEAEKKRAEYVKEMLTLFFGKPYVNGVYLWGFQDKTMWRAEDFGEKVGLFNEDFSLNEVGKEFFKKINEDWKTDLKGKSDENGKLQFRGFPGIYKITNSRSKRSEVSKIL